MNDKVKYVLKVFFQLNPDEQVIFIKEVEKLLTEQKDKTKKEQFNETLERSLGPLSIGNCACCGK